MDSNVLGRKCKNGTLGANNEHAPSSRRISYPSRKTCPNVVYVTRRLFAEFRCYLYVNRSSINIGDQSGNLSGCRPSPAFPSKNMAISHYKILVKPKVAKISDLPCFASSQSHIRDRWDTQQVAAM
jgi:hypothetical protein